MSNVRDATVGDVAQMVELIEARRARLADYQPVFWQRAEDAASKTKPWFESLIKNEKAITLVAEDRNEISGFLISAEAPVPPVYDPGGSTWLVDDFAVRDSSLWATVGQQLLHAVKAETRRRGGRQIVIVAPADDRDQMELLRAEGLSAASVWFTQTL